MNLDQKKRRMLQNKVALITGAGRGIGRATAIRLAQARSHVVLLSRNVTELAEVASQVEACGRRSLVIVADVTADACAEDTVDQIRKKFGRLDILINNAGIAGPVGPVADMDMATWLQCFQVNLHAPVAFCKAALGLMHEGRIINVASGAGTFPIPYFSAYVSSKCALIRFSEILAKEVADRGIKVFAIEPGTVRTSLAEQTLQMPDAQKWMPWFQDLFTQGRDIPVAQAAEFIYQLASGKADQKSGHFCFVDGRSGSLQFVETGS